MIDADRLQTADRLFHELLALPVAARPAALTARCRGDEALRTMVRRLLDADSSGMTGFLSRPIAPAARLTDDTLPPAIGPYAVVREIGRGGMGVVYEARQVNPSRAVALKVLRSAFPTREALYRFRHESEILGALRHPGIAQVYEAGVAELDGPPGGQALPFFAMELVPGEPLTAYADRRGLDLRQRLALLASVCDAVQHAHQNGVIHRDLKPGNILVDEQGRPKVLDFGVARAARTETEATSEHTAAGQLIGTLPYMSPEQVSGDPRGVDTRADVYALGVMLFELITGQLPHDLRGLGLADAIRRIREEPPPRPAALRRGLDADLETIVATAMDKDVARRYASAAALADDIRHYLRNEPIGARPPSAIYQLRKFAQRNRGLVAGLGLALAALLAGMVGTTSGLIWALHEKGRADTEAFRARQSAEAAEAAKATAQEKERQATESANTLEEVVSFQESQLRELDVAEVGVRLRNDIRAARAAALRREQRSEAEVEQALDQLESALAGVNFTSLALGTLEENIFDRTLAAIDAEFGDQPPVRARLLHTAAYTLREIGLLERGLAPQREALRIWREALGDGDRHTLSAINNLGVHLHAMGKFAEAEPLLRDAVAGYRRLLGDDHDETLSSIASLAAVLSSRNELSQAEVLQREVLETRVRRLGPDDPRTLSAQNSMGTLYSRQGRQAEATQQHRLTLDGRRRALGDDHPETISAMSNLGAALLNQGKLAEAEPILREAVERSARTQGDEHPDALQARYILGALLREHGRLDEAEPLLKAALDGRRRMLGDDHPRTLQAVGTYAALLRSRGDLSRAEVLIRDALSRSEATVGPNHPATIAWIKNVGSVLDEQGFHFEAEMYYRTALDRRRQLLGDMHPETIPSLSDLGQLLEKQDRLEEAEPLLREAVEAAQCVLGEDHPNTLGVMHNLGRLCRRMGRAEEAEALGAHVVAQAQRTHAPQDFRLARYRSEYGRTLAALGRFGAAQDQFAAALELCIKVHGPADARTHQLLSGLIEVCDAGHAADPNGGHDRVAADWRAQIESALAAASRPAEAPPNP